MPVRSQPFPDKIADTPHIETDGAAEVFSHLHLPRGRGVFGSVFQSSCASSLGNTHSIGKSFTHSPAPVYSIFSAPGEDAS